MNNNLTYLFIIGIIIYILFYNKNLEHYVDPYSIDMQAEALNRMKRWNMFSSRKYSSLNNYLYPPNEQRCYYKEY